MIPLFRPRPGTLSEALERPGALADAPAVHAVLSAAEITIVVPPDVLVVDALVPLFLRLETSGVRKRRVEVVVSVPPGERPFVPWRLCEIRKTRPEVRVHAHDPEHATWFTVPVDGRPMAIDDVLRESEVIVLAGMITDPQDPRPLTRMLVPGLASPEVRAECSHLMGDSTGTAVAQALGIDLVIGFDPVDEWRIYCGTLEGMARKVWAPLIPLQGAGRVLA